MKGQISARAYLFTIKFTCWIGSLKIKVQIWYKYVSCNCVSVKMYFGGGNLTWVLSSPSKYKLVLTCRISAVE